MQSSAADSKVIRSCSRCGEVWLTRCFASSAKFKPPKNCPRCKSPYWDKERTKLYKLPRSVKYTAEEIQEKVKEFERKLAEKQSS